MFNGLQQLCMLCRLVFVCFFEKNIKNTINFDNMPVSVDRVI